MRLFRRPRPVDDRFASLEAALAQERADRQALIGRLDALEGQLRAGTDRIAELAIAIDNQLREVSDEVEATRKRVEEQLAAADSLTAGRIAAFRAELDKLADGPDVTELSERQTRLANELARHEIALREELAAVADRLTRQRPHR
jgi:hypothetical protein